MPSALTPWLTALDRRVLAELGEGAQRARTVAERVYGEPRWYCEHCGHRESRPARRTDAIPCHACWRASWDTPAYRHLSDWPHRMRPVLRVADAELAEVREVLRGLECVGHVVCVRGWWRRA